MLQVVKIGLTSAEFKAYQAEEATWNTFDINNPPVGVVEYRYEDGGIDREDISDLTSPELITHWRSV